MFLGRGIKRRGIKENLFLNFMSNKLCHSAHSEDQSECNKMMSTFFSGDTNSENRKSVQFEATVTETTTEIMKEVSSAKIADKKQRRSRSISRRRVTTATYSLVPAERHSRRHGPRVTVDTLPGSDSEGGATGKGVYRANSLVQEERRGRGYFRGVGSSFSTSAKRRKGRTPGSIKTFQIIGKGRGLKLFGRAISPSPERLK